MTALSSLFPQNTSTLVYASNVSIATGTETIDSFADTQCNGVHWFYSVKKGANLRTGIVMAGWDVSGDTIEHTETSTNDVGDTSDLTFDVDISSDTVRLRATAASDDWEVRVQRMEVGASAADAGTGVTELASSAETITGTGKNPPRTR